MVNSIEKWSMYEVCVKGPDDGNPFTDYNFSAIFSSNNESVETDGFYDGDGNYKVRFMPSFTGKYTYKTMGNFNGAQTEGQFEVISPSEDNHGPVRVVNQYHFCYEDGTPYYPSGTTCYAFAHQLDERRMETVSEVKKAGFNKMRFCVFPKHYIYNFRDPVTFPYVGTPVDASGITRENFYMYTFKKDGNNWDFKRFNPEHFRRIEWCIENLEKIGCEADIIVMHPYDRWGFCDMKPEEDDLYWKYVIARFSAYRNVWWAFANEYDLMQNKTIQDWERYASIVVDKDKYHHLRSIHNCMAFYDHTRPWITHCSIQRQDLHKTSEFTADWRMRFGKPVVLDEIAYEGNINDCWGNISPQEMTRRFWEAAVRGGYGQHSETYVDPNDVLWWSHGGKLHGESWKRMKFLLDILKQTPGYGLKPYHSEPKYGGGFTWDDTVAVPEESRYSGQYYITYYSIFRPSFRNYYIDDVTEYHVEIIDTWNMTIEDAGVHKGKFRIDLPGREYMAVRFTKV
jgi:hypothetical protein